MSEAIGFHVWQPVKMRANIKMTNTFAYNCKKRLKYIQWKNSRQFIKHLIATQQYLA